MSTLVAAAQFTAEPGRCDENRTRTLRLVEEAAGRGANLVVLPELAVSGYTLRGEILFAAAEPLDGPTLRAWTDAAQKHSLLIAGGFCEVEGDRLFNSAVLVGPQGMLLHYRKLHLFDREKLVFARGDKGLEVVDTSIGRIGMCVCYDLRFVEVMRALALAGADIVAVPTAWVGGFDKVPRDGDGLIGQARGAIVQANLNQTYVVCASQGGSADEINFLGSSLICDPYGALLAGPASDDIEETIIAPIDIANVQKAQLRSDLIRPRADRRTDVYGLKLGDRNL
ncbi:nitrilase-related carbon-nitrogen hydrolase [Mesorhizobium sp. SP-1A]|uniref:nitrilase-related carbon-nitrogen hydrolase n=1 Tax=Mesorhizobium sp. SP-1A TaxID=3077840 RepID=UPI0028F6E6F7|nr:nitrilase-related carbon-nitrogen hydrolase [Mesorhizobium sp. SP-1A]